MATVATQRLQTALELHEAGVELMRMKLRRKYPDASPEELARRLSRWLQPETGFGRVATRSGLVLK